MNNAQKKLNADRAPTNNPQLIALSDLSTTNNEWARNIPPTKERDDSPLFFPETSTLASRDRKDSTEKSVNDDASLVSSVEASPPLLTTVPVQSNTPHEVNFPAPPDFKPPGVIRTMTGRVFGKDEILVHLKLGDHDVGDMLVLHFPIWLRTIMIKLREGYQLQLHFEQSMVFKPTEFAEISRAWPPEAVATGAIKPFGDTEASISSLAQYLEEHDLVALWEHPNEDDTIGLVLYSPRAKSWWRRGRETCIQGSPLVLEARNRAYRGLKPVSLRPKPVLIPDARLDMAQAPPAQLAHPNQSAFQVHPSRLQLLSLETAFPQDDHMHLDASVANTPAISHDPRKRRESIADAVASKLQTRGDSDVSKSPAVERSTEQAIKTDWSVRADFRSLTRASASSSGKAFVYIAFAEQFPNQAEALKEWSGKHTSSRLIYTDMDPERDWDDFRTSSNTALLLFHDNNPSFCILKDVFLLLGRDNVACYTVSFTIDPQKGVKYDFSRLFPRGSVLLLTEHTIITRPEESVFALEWFKQNSKKNGYKIMVRPNIRAWLQQIALECEDDEKAKKLFEILRLVFKMSSAVTDVTVGKDIDDNDFLSADSSLEADVDNFIVPLPPLAGYDASPSAPSCSQAIAVRDDQLLSHFIYWSVMNASNYRRFIALDDYQTRKGVEKGAAKPEGAEHIKFYKPETFMRDQQKSKSAEGEKA